MQCKLIIAMLAFVLAGCATQPSGVSVDQVTKFREQGVSIGNVKGASAVTLQTKGKAMGSFVLGTIAASAVASSPSSLSPQGMQEAQQAGFAAGDVVQHTVDAIGNDVQQAQTPAMAMAAALNHSLTEGGLGADSAAYHVDIKQALWMLSYDSMFGSDNYRLHWQLNANVLNSANKVVTASVCKGDGDAKLGLNAWKADDYAQVKDAARHVGERCAKQFLDDIGLRG